MTRARALGLCALVWIVACAGAGDASARVETPRAALLVSDSELPPADTEPWEPVALPYNARVPGIQERFDWCRAEFDVGGADSDPQLVLYVPYLYNGAALFLNDGPL